MKQLINSTDLAPEIALLAEEARTLSDVLQALELEHDALIEGDALQLEQAVAQKTSALDAHARLRAQREQIGLKSLSAAELTARANLSEGQRLSGLQLVDQLRTAGDACQRLNNKNGMMIAGLRDRTHRALSVLRGTPDVTLYGNRGSTDPDMGSRVLGTA